MRHACMPGIGIFFSPPGEGVSRQSGYDLLRYPGLSGLILYCTYQGSYPIGTHVNSNQSAKNNNNDISEFWVPYY